MTIFCTQCKTLVEPQEVTSYIDAWGRSKTVHDWERGCYGHACSSCHEVDCFVDVEELMAENDQLRAKVREMEAACHVCGSRTRRNCSCPFYAENH